MTTEDQRWYRTKATVNLIREAVVEVEAVIPSGASREEAHALLITTAEHKVRDWDWTDKKTIVVASARLGEMVAPTKESGPVSTGVCLCKKGPIVCSEDSEPVDGSSGLGQYLCRKCLQNSDCVQQFRVDHPGVV